MYVYVGAFRNISTYNNPTNAASHVLVLLFTVSATIKSVSLLLITSAVTYAVVVVAHTHTRTHPHTHTYTHTYSC